MINLLYILGVIIILSFAFVCFFGAPFVPTRKKWAKEALGMVKLSGQDLVIDLGSGNGTILRLLEKQNVKSIGYEINPILWLISKIRFLFSKTANVKLANFWNQNLPEKTTVVYVFALVRDKNKLEKYLKKQSKNRPIKVITFGFALPNYKSLERTKGAFLYQF